MKKPWVFYLFLIFAAERSFAQTTIYVDVSRVTGANDGSSWANAFQGALGLQAALAAAAPGTQIWIAQGRYTPAGVGGSRSVSFALKSGVELYGGFVGNETDVGQRDPAAHQTILSGDLNGNDTPGGGNTNDNSLHVVRATNIDSTCILDGLTVRDGAASGVSNLERTGANMLLESGGPVIRNCLITLGNAGVTGGGAALMNSAARFESCRFISNKSQSGCGGLANLNAGSPVITGCRFEGNLCGFGGGGFFNGPFIVGGTVGGLATVQDCDFINNTGNSGIGMMVDRSPTNIKRCRFYGNVGNGGAGIYIGNSPSAIVSCDFVNNQAPGDGGSGIFVGGSQGTPATPVLANCRFVGNNGAINVNSGSVMAVNCTFANNTLSAPPFQAWPVVNSGGQTTLRNCLIWGNVPVGSGLNGILSGISITADYCCIQAWDGSRPGTGTFAADPLYVNVNGPDGQPGTVDDDLHPSFGSPCIDTGSDLLLPPDSADLDGDGNVVEPLPRDLDARIRVMKCHVDIGGYEFVAGAPGSGDMNGDAVVDILDVDPFAAAILAGAPNCIVDTNADGGVDALDIGGFVRRLLP